jgi:hypothetical protein
MINPNSLPPRSPRLPILSGLKISSVNSLFACLLLQRRNPIIALAKLKRINPTVNPTTRPVLDWLVEEAAVTGWRTASGVEVVVEMASPKLSKAIKMSQFLGWFSRWTGSLDLVICVVECIVVVEKTGRKVVVVRGTTIRESVDAAVGLARVGEGNAVVVVVGVDIMGVVDVVSMGMVIVVKLEDGAVVCESDVVKQ